MFLHLRAFKKYLMSQFNFLVLGAGRGGTSLLAGLLDAHPDIEVGFEKFSVKILMNQQSCGFWKSQLNCRISKFKAACYEEAKKHSAKFWSNKITTEQLIPLEGLSNKKNAKEVFFKAFSQQKIIFILRDGRTSIPSKMNRNNLDIDTACKNWQHSIKVYEYLKKSNNQCFFIKFEDLLQNPTKSLEGICQFLEVEYTDEMLKGTDNPKMLEGYRQKTIDSSKVSEAMTFQPWHENIKYELEIAGYI